MPQNIDAIVQVGPSDWLAFETPSRVVGASTVDGVRTTLAEVERLTRDFGLHAVGFVTYEAGAAFGLSVRPPEGDMPLAWFALFEPAQVRRVPRPASEADYQLGPLSPTIDRATFGTAFEQVKAHLAAGDSYQINFTFHMVGSFEGDPRSLFADLVEAQGGSYSAFIRIGDLAICSASPELFFSLDGTEVRARPMKGTSRRGRTLVEDRQQRDNLRQSAKQRAENVMIVDMVRNDLGRIADVGSVAVPDLFVAERYPTVWQLTSLVTARSTASLEDIFGAVHPSASVTGAPKVRTMELLSRLEHRPRGVYTGAIGHVRPDGNAAFNVAIRTAVVDSRAKTVEFGIGSGIVWDSDVDAEYDECLLKGVVLGRRPERFDLIETLRWTPGEGYFILDRHLARLRDSAEYFGFVYSVDDVQAALDQAVSGAVAPLRVRLRLGREGDVRVEHAPHVTGASPLKVALAASPVDTTDVWLYHKTTNRSIYERARTGRPGFDEVILWNRSGQITEGTTTNVVVDLGGRLVTPPVACGLLAGTYRAELLARGSVSEGVVTRDELQSARQIWLVNSVHESRPAVLVS